MTKKVWIVVAAILAGLNLSGCSNMQSKPMVATAEASSQMQLTNPNGAPTTLDAQGNEVPVNNLGSGSGSLTSASFGNFSEYDQRKLARALDAAPGKTSKWTNLVTGVSYSVTPVKKVVVNNNQLCRYYQTVATKGGQTTQASATACIADDGSWHNV